MEKEKIENKSIEEEILENIKIAINNVEKSFYKVTSASGKKRARERVFCYELYHQLRLLDFNHKFNIHGELVKGGLYPGIKLIPDFLFHKQGTHKNYCIMEVKGRKNCEGIIKDFQTLTSFLNAKTLLTPYKLAIFFIYNHSLDKLVSYLKKKEINLDKYSDQIIILCKKDKNSKIEESTLKEIIEKI